MQSDPELEMLRLFYDSWVAYHTIPKDRKDSQREMGEYLISIHNDIQNMRRPVILHA